MKVAIKYIGAAAVTAVLATQHTLALAQGGWGILVTYVPSPSTSVPTLSEWGMMGLSLIVAAFAVYTLRNKRDGKPIASVILALALAMGGISSNNLMGEAKATLTPPNCPDLICSMADAAGGGIVSQRLGADVMIRNDTGVAQTITGVSAISPPTVDISSAPATNPRCTVGLVVQPATGCYILNSGTGYGV